MEQLDYASRRDSVASLMTIESAADMAPTDISPMSPRSDRIRHHLIPARTSTCVRAPCLKRQVSTPVSASDLSMTIPVIHQQDRIVSTPLPLLAPEDDLAEPEAHSRRVHFDQAPPQEFFVLSGEKYDRTSIKCTQGGSAFDMSLPPRANSPDSDDHSTSPHDSTSPDVGSVNNPTLDSWASIKNGGPSLSMGYEPKRPHSGLMASGKSLHFSALSSLQHASALAGHETPPVERETSEQVSLPVHGFRSFGRLSGLNSLGLETGICTPPQQEEAAPVTLPSHKKTFSPDATPMPSPSLHRSLSWQDSGEYFDTSPTRVNKNDTTQEGANPLSVFTKKSEVAEEDEQLAFGPTCTTPRVEGADDSAPLTPLATAKETLAERRSFELSPQTSSLLHPYTPSLLTSHGGAGWTKLLGAVGSPLSSRCSSIDPWSSLSSDGDGTDSPGHEANWTSSSCTSPDLAPSEQNGDSFASQPQASAQSCPTSERTLPIQIGGDASEAADLAHSDFKKSEASELVKLSSSMETVHTPSAERTQASATLVTRFSPPSSSICSTPETSTAASSRRPSFRIFDFRSRREESLSLDDDDMALSRTGSSSRDGHAKKAKSSKCKACRLLRHRFKSATMDSSLSPGSAPMTDGETDSSYGTPPMHRSSSSSDHEPAELTRSSGNSSRCSLNKLRASVRSLSMCDGGSLSGSSVRSQSTDRSASFDSAIQSSSPRVKQTMLDHDLTQSPAESSSESPSRDNITLPLSCTCDKKKDKERVKKKIRKERELERERDRKWEQNEARGRQQKLFGESFGAVDGSCLDGF